MQQLNALALLKQTPIFMLLGLVLVATQGCRQDGQPTNGQAKPKAISRPIRVIIVEDPPFAKMFARQWSARTERKLDLREWTIEQLDQVKQLGADIIIYPSACLGTLAHRKLIAPPSASAMEAADYDQMDVFELQRHAEIRWGQEPYAFSFGSPQLVLMYRADLFSKLGLTPPDTWVEYQSLVEKLGRATLGDAAPPKDQPWSAACEPMQGSWAGKTLLARAASYASHPSQFSVLFDYTTMEPLIAGPPFVRALEELIAAAKWSPADVEQITPLEARRRLLAGQSAMALTWPSHTPAGSEPLKMAAGVEIGFAELPGATTAYDFGEQQWTPREGHAPIRVPLIGIAGKLGSVAQNARRPREAAEILALLSSRKWSDRLSPASSSTTMFRESQTTKPELWTDVALPLAASKRYAKVVSTTQMCPNHLSSIRVPGWQRYLEALDQAVHAALSGDQSAQNALAETAKTWTAITTELGLDSQRAAYTRSLGLEP